MKNLFEASSAAEIRTRLQQLRPDCQRQWGAMSAAQMMSHCSGWFEMAAGLASPPRSLLGRIVGGMAKKSMMSEKPIGRNLPTDKTLIRNQDCDFAAEQQRLIGWVDSFSSTGQGLYKTHPHSFFGPMTPMEWAVMGYKHTDHHLRQFGG